MKKLSLYSFLFVGMWVMALISVRKILTRKWLLWAKSWSAWMTTIKRWCRSGRRYNAEIQSSAEWNRYICRFDELPSKCQGKTLYAAGLTSRLLSRFAIGDDYRLYKPSINQVYIGKVNKAKSSAGAGNALGFMSMNRERLPCELQCGLPRNRKRGRRQHLAFAVNTENRDQLQIGWAVGQNQMECLLGRKSLSRNNDTTTVTLQNIRKNVQIANIFCFKYFRKEQRDKGIVVRGKSETQNTFDLFIFFVLVGSVFAIEGIAQGPLGTILARMEAHNKTLDTVQSNVTMCEDEYSAGRNRHVYWNNELYP